MGHEVFKDLDNAVDEDEIGPTFRMRESPSDPYICSAITSNCWNQLYSSAGQVVAGLEALTRSAVHGETLDPTVVHDEVFPSAASWLSGLCTNQIAPRVPPSFRKLVGAG